MVMRPGSLEWVESVSPHGPERRSLLMSCHTQLSERADDSGCFECFDHGVKMTDTSAHELVAAIPLDIGLESYRERLIPLAQATLSGAARRQIDRQRDSVLPDVWDEPLARVVAAGVAHLRRIVEAAEADLARPARASRVAAAVVDRLLFELLEHQDENFTALASLEAELQSIDSGERAGRALCAARGAAAGARIPRNEIRAAIVRVARTTEGGELDGPDAVEKCTQHLARLLATDRRREAARAWVAQMAALQREPFPLLAAELSLLAEQTPAAEPDHDPIWLQACFGMVLEQSLASS